MEKDLEYGQWVTYNGERLMIINWTDSGSMLHLYKGHDSRWVPVEETSERSSFLDTPEERKAKGYEF